MSWKMNSRQREELKNGNLEKLIGMLQGEIDLNPAEPGPLLVIADVLSELSRFSEALSLLRQARQCPRSLTSGEVEMISHGIYHCLLDLGELDDAIREATSFFVQVPAHDSPVFSYYQSFQDIMGLRLKYTDSQIRQALENERHQTSG